MSLGALACVVVNAGVGAARSTVVSLIRRPSTMPDEDGLVYSHTDFDVRPYRWPRWGGGDGSMMQSLLAAAPGRREKGRVQYVGTRDGAVLAVHWFGESSSGNGGNVVVMLVPGLAGDSTGNHTTSFKDMATERGWGFCVFERRGHGLSAFRTGAKPYPMHADTDDLACAVLGVSHSSQSRIALVGVSQGANLVVNYAASKELDRSVLCAVSVSNGLDMLAGLKHLKTRPLLNSLVVRNLHKVVRTNARKIVASGRITRKDVRLALRGSSIPSTERPLLESLYGIKHLERYYAESSCIRRLISVNVPTLMIHADDDPLLPPLVTPAIKLACLSNSLLSAVVSRHGGHAGFFQQLGGRWHVDVAGDFVTSTALRSAAASPNRPVSVEEPNLA